jgi:hypothetical protein
MSYRVGVGSIFKKTNIYGVIKYYQIVSGSIEFIGSHTWIWSYSIAYVHTSKFNANIEVCLLKLANA